MKKIFLFLCAIFAFFVVSGCDKKDYICIDGKVSSDETKECRGLIYIDTYNSENYKLVPELKDTYSSEYYQYVSSLIDVHMHKYLRYNEIFFDKEVLLSSEIKDQYKIEVALAKYIYDNMNKIYNGQKISSNKILKNVSNMFGDEITAGELSKIYSSDTYQLSCDLAYSYDSDNDVFTIVVESAGCGGNDDKLSTYYVKEEKRKGYIDIYIATLYSFYDFDKETIFGYLNDDSLVHVSSDSSSAVPNVIGGEIIEAQYDNLKQYKFTFKVMDNGNYVFEKMEKVN